MIRALQAEWYKLMRPGMLIGGLGTIIGFALLIVLIIFLNAEETPVQPPGGGNPDEQLPTIRQLEEPEGMVIALAVSGTVIGVVALVLFAQSVGSEYAHGTLRILLSREPRRINLLAGKLVAIGLFVMGCVLVAWVAQTLLAVIVAQGRGIDTSEWWSVDGWAEAFGTTVRVVVAALVFGLLGSALAVGLRSAAPAIGIGIGYTVVAEQLLLLAWSEGRKWVPGQVINHFSLGGTDLLSLPRATALVVLYGVLFLSIQAYLFLTRDVST